MEIIWSEARIRAEIERLDRKTGLRAAELPIVLMDRMHALGSFSTEQGKPKEFRFSNRYFQNPDFPEENALDCIRHEYAHYLDFILNGKMGHQKTWKQCCVHVGAMPIRLYNADRADYYRKKHEKERQLQIQTQTLSPGLAVWHPSFGCGTVRSREGDGICSVVCVDFNDIGSKRLSAVWVLNNCQCGTPASQVS